MLEIYLFACSTWLGLVFGLLQNKIQNWGNALTITVHWNEECWLYRICLSSLLFLDVLKQFKSFTGKTFTLNKVWKMNSKLMWLHILQSIYITIHTSENESAVWKQDYFSLLSNLQKGCTLNIKICFIKPGHSTFWPQCSKAEKYLHCCILRLLWKPILSYSETTIITL